MKILLFGEFSAFHKNLKEGLQELGHDAIIASTGDGFKKIPVDISFDSSLPGLLGKIDRRLKPVYSLKYLKGYDVVQLINPFFLYHKLLPMQYFFDRLISNNSKFFILGAGDDAFFWRHSRKKLSYGPFDDYLKYDIKANKSFMESDSAYKFNAALLNKSLGIIPIMYEYEVAYKGHDKLLNTIPIPMNVDKIEYTDNKVGRKLVVFHGLNRYGFKGTRHVEEAFCYLANKYPNDLELIIDGKMPLTEYLDVMKRANVVIDQLNSYSLGVNGIYALAMGKVVMGGAEPESLNSLGVKTSPAINLKPNPESIIHEIEKLLDKKSEIPIIGYNGRVFTEEVHGHVKVAEKYIKTWTSTEQQHNFKKIQ